MIFGFFQKISGFRHRPQLTSVNMAINPAFGNYQSPNVHIIFYTSRRKSENETMEMDGWLSVSTLHQCTHT
jgi:hypothetical protein